MPSFVEINKVGHGGNFIFPSDIERVELSPIAIPVNIGRFVLTLVELLTVARDGSSNVQI
jgi:hypothetical protein